MNRYLLSVLVAGSIAYAMPAHGNDASFYGDGATVFAVKEERVLMDRESITIRYDDSSDDHTRSWVAECVFTFRNISKEAIEIQMGFPDWYGHGDDASPDSYVIRDFKVEVAGKAIRATHKAISKKPGKTADGQLLPNQVKLAYDAAYTWKVRFEPGQTVVVKNTYRFGGFSSNGPFSACIWDKKAQQVKGVFWRAAKKKADGWDFENCLCRSVTYIVTTGRTWGGPIGKAEIAIQIPPNVWPHLLVPLPNAARVENGWVKWRFENWTPKDELTVLFIRPAFPDGPTFLPLFDTLAQARAWIRFAKKNGFGPKTIALLRKAYSVRHGARPDAAFTRLMDTWGDPPTTKTPLDRNERRIVDALRRLEKQAGKKRARK